MPVAPGVFLLRAINDHAKRLTYMLGSVSIDHNTIRGEEVLNSDTNFYSVL